MAMEYCISISCGIIYIYFHLKWNFIIPLLFFATCSSHTWPSPSNVLKICCTLNSVACSLQANYTDWATATHRRILVPTFADRGVLRGQRGGTPTAVNLSFLDFFLQVAPHLSSRGWVDSTQDPLLFRKSGGARNWIRDLWVCSQELRPLHCRGSQTTYVPCHHLILILYLFNCITHYICALFFLQHRRFGCHRMFKRDMILLQAHIDNKKNYTDMGLKMKSFWVKGF
jgi:hypothetical protein